MDRRGMVCARVVGWIVLWKTLLLGIVEGLTEFLPISSTGHLILVGKAIDLHDPTFDIFIQLGAIGSVAVLYRQDLRRRLRGSFRPGADQRVLTHVLTAFLPAAILGVMFLRAIKTHLFTPLSVAAALIVGGVGIILIERRKTTARAHALNDVSRRQALAIGCAQVISMWPGFSRAAASILGGMLAGLDRTTATIFSFYLAIPTMVGATVLDLIDARHDLRLADAPVYAVGFAVAFLVALAAIKGLLRYIAHHNFTVFGIYRIVLGIAIVLLTM